MQNSHGDDDLLLTGFTFDEVQTLEIQDFCRDFVAMSFDQHSSTLVLDMMRGMSFLLGFGLGRRLHGSSEFVTTIDHDTPFRLGFTPSKDDVHYMAWLHRDRMRARFYLASHLIMLFALTLSVWPITLLGDQRFSLVLRRWVLMIVQWMSFSIFSIKYK